MSVSEHKQQSKPSITCKVITISDTRDESSDKSGQLMMDFLTSSGHVVKDYEIVKDHQQAIRESIELGCSDERIEAVLTNGGTGMAKRDVTIETVEGMLDKEMVGFGELFRMLSYTEDIGSAAMLSRAIAGVRNQTILFSTPGSTGAVRLAMEKLIMPELPHVVRELSK
ncbi:molybdenum cofactor biosynthesis protein [Pontibacillus yanchengensis]|uniref:Molybdenum cofactor biosynthesis protein n=2 Tax=Pontibacillus yanchengensis TaxID=462910 RepID=A0ACC7VEJ5_9BACI|nr:MogA/MoaB family molybdenum cofactor biosynthesis protein [Pontibacillus yanchengensis]MYL34115.1 molybdenum cofactor biosynthesis protein [Pontibacillus yanchengensis]MYL53208.1 molybdenum cofactor biosynthesis protein [Pontibacillus yanchengensis]